MIKSKSVDIKIKNMTNRFFLRIANIRFFLLIIFVLTMRVDGSIPVTYTCCHDFSDSSGIQLDSFENVPLGGTQIDNFENLSNWTAGSGMSQQVDTINFHEGIQGLKLTAKNGNSAYTTKIINSNFSTVKNFLVWIYIYDVNTFRNPIIYITSSANWNKSFKQELFGPFHPGWNKLVFDKDNFVQDTGINESWNNLMNRIRLGVYPNSNPDAIVTFDDLRYDVNYDWIGTYQEADTVNFKEGQQGLKLVANIANGVDSFGRAGAYTDKVINKDFSTTNNFVVWVYVNDASHADTVSIYFTSTGVKFTKYFTDNEYRALKTGWNRLIFNKDQFKNNGGESWNNIMNRIRLRIYSMSGSDVNITFDDLRYDMTGQRAKLMIQFDDGELNAYTKAYPILSANNQPGISYVITSYIGNDIDYMDLAELRTLQDAGWDISSHTVHHIDLTTVNDLTQTSELNDSYDWLVANGFQKSAGFIAYPFGGFNDIVFNKVKKRYIFGRATKPEIAQPHFTQTDDSGRYVQRIIGIYNNTPVQNVTDQIDDVINSKLLGILMFHTISDTNPNQDIYTYLTPDFKKVSDYIKSRNTDIDVVTYDDYLIPNINSFTPVINKTTRINSDGISTLITKNQYDEYMPNMTVMPLSGSIDVGITTYNETGGNVKFNESGNNLQVAYSIGDRIPNQVYEVIIYLSNGIKYQDFNVLSDNNGYIRYDSLITGTRYQEIKIINGHNTYSAFNIIYNVI